MGPFDPSGPAVTFDARGPVTTRGAFNGQPLTVHGVTSTPSQFGTACNSSGGVTTLSLSASSTLVIGTLPPPPPPTTTTSTTTTTLAPTTTTAAPTTTIPVTTTTFLPPDVVNAVGQACQNLAAAVSPFGVDLGPLYVACVESVNGQGPTLLNLFLDAPALGCVFLAGVPVASDPQVAAACVTFADAIQPYSSLLGGPVSSLP
jgi:hypothetical protein